MYSSFLFNAINHIPIPFYTNSKAGGQATGRMAVFFSAFFFGFFFGFFSYLFFLTFSFLIFSPSLFLSTFLPFSTSLPFPSILHQSQFLYVRIAAPERKETREPRRGSRINFMLERALSCTRGRPMLRARYAVSCYGTALYVRGSVRSGSCLGVFLQYL
ncbi:hypothetical protein B9Z19DRAFT_259485 [Tuber borchii]|uniref:Uncharacterized protein n=1 Tax=Tuber borchii TaxID=42251 RepID=A0A2T6ZLG0_TUBBO|nr:hypothetical protein B9Z19DRAFT_259485 [Tuber borchii]